MLKDMRMNTVPCPLCGSQMDPFASIPAAADLPELLRFRCQPCGVFKTVEVPDWQPIEAGKTKAA